jgi:hypothetical protein
MAKSRDIIADWIEATLVVRGSHLSVDQINQVVSEELQVSEPQVSLALQTIKKRAAILKDRYPIEDLTVALKPRRSALMFPYTLLLFLSAYSPVRELISPDPDEVMTVIFERLVVSAMKSLLGPESRALRFGWPSDEGRPVEFYKAIDWLAAKLEIRPGNAYRPPRRKDGGVDVIAWRPFPDKKSGFPLFLVQCTLQGDLVTKSQDIDVRNWAGWLTLDSDPVTVLASPCTISEAKAWDELALKNLLLDRIRLAGLLDSNCLLSDVGAHNFLAATESSLKTKMRGIEV